ncbi:glycosyltransferase-like protein, family 2 [Candidatus Desulfofervidus auxilii]|uniref:Glycosyltransferase-like protein, family 2 n=2 Tax=Desulfofervidus auxilii TaxID=1621989 RepID=A0A7U4TI45_DESA2|nr:glycosyltransferase [Candidatus Desulfofervidus auxilii]AMM40936.1 glycosyltransferase-like protein, family 2 [Candidatus Desulfofervidus auxilii]CAD7775370.1 Glycosyl transferase family 2 [Candidatus Methanoperedenaceae archaeon GB50]CAD7775880.1 MAG: Glycosyl transferase family 2 [Candidatus Methanoperedenaceae archaeon GB37]
MPKVSIIIPTYNRAQFLKEAIESVFNQTYQNYELIVVDDGSEDNTKQIIARYKDRLTYTDIPHQGVSKARNTGVNLAKGEFICFLDSDDLWLPKKLEFQMAFFDSHPDALICQTEEIWVRNGIRVNPKKHCLKPSGMMFAQSLRRCLISPSAVMMHRRLFDLVGLFDESFLACEDYDLWLRVTARYPVYLLSLPLVIKRGGHSDQLSRKVEALDKWRIKAIEKMLVSGALTPKQYALAIKELRYKCEIYAKGCLKRGKIKEGLYYLNLPNNYARE